ncbi:hypothetical protein LTR17_014229 [Elasticomyces elasticus]|nr:hypothetical protein LTR17_014229 [Elasticomyces elasticus]
MARKKVVNNASQPRTITNSSAAAHASVSVTNKMAPRTNARRLYSDIVTGRSAATEVFRTFELCEMIIQDFRPIDLIRVSGLNHTTRAVIADSTKMQEMLFLKPVPDNECKLWGLNRWGNLIAGEKAHQVLEGTDANNDDPRTMSESTRLQVAHEITHAFSPHIVNDLVLWYHPSSRYGGIVNSAYEYIHKVSGRAELMVFRDTLIFKPLSPYASCRGMYLSQPPVHSISVTVYKDDTPAAVCGYVRKDRPMFTAKFTLSNPTGLTFGEVIDRLHYELRENTDYDPDYSGADFSFEDGLPIKDAHVKARVEEAGLIDRFPW